MEFRPVRVFADGLSDDEKFVAHSIDDDCFSGRLAQIADAARQIGGPDFSDSEALNQLKLGDCLLGAAVDADDNPMSILDASGTEVALTRETVHLVEAVSFLPWIAHGVEGVQAVVVDDSEEPELRTDVTGSAKLFCAAFALSHAYQAVRWTRHVDWLATSGGYHAMIAAEACTLARVFDRAEAGALGVMQRPIYVAAARHAADTRWKRLDPVKQLAFQRRREMAELSRSAAIDRMLGEILAAAREAGEPLTGGDPKATVTRWFRVAGIK